MRLAALVTTLSLITACGGGDGSGPDLSFELLDSYGVATEVHIIPSDAGRALGMRECTMSVTTTAAREPQDAPRMTCDGCEAVYAGTPNGVMTDCPDADMSGEAFYGLLPRTDGDLDLWVEEAGALVPQGAAAASAEGGSWSLNYSQQIGNDTFDMGQANVHIVFEE